MLAMANRAYMSIWAKAFTEATMFNQLESFLKTVPVSGQWAGFTELVIHALDATETSVVERDLRGRQVSATELVEMAREYSHADSAYEVKTYWDLWVYEPDPTRWQLRSQPLEITCYGEEYDGGAYVELGHFQAELGFEHLFTGHGGLLGSRRANGTRPEQVAEAKFLAAMSPEEELSEYYRKTRANIQQLMDWMQAVEDALPGHRYKMWSEGEENFEARLDEILAVR